VSFLVGVPKLRLNFFEPRALFRIGNLVNAFNKDGLTSFLSGNESLIALKYRKCRSRSVLDRILTARLRVKFGPI